MTRRKFVFASRTLRTLTVLNNILDIVTGRAVYIEEGHYQILNLTTYPIVKVFDWCLLSGFFEDCNGSNFGQVASREIDRTLLNDVIFFEQGDSAENLTCRLPYIYYPSNLFPVLSMYTGDNTELADAVRTYMCYGYTALQWTEFPDKGLAAYQVPLIHYLAADTSVYMQSSKIILAALCYDKLASRFYAKHPDDIFEEVDRGETLRTLFYDVCTPYEASIAVLSTEDSDALKRVLSAYESECDIAMLDKRIEDFLSRYSDLFNKELLSE